MQTELTLSLTLLTLALAACTPESEGENKQRTPNPLDGFELASASAATGEIQDRVIDLGPSDLASMLEAGNVRLIDVRTAEEVAKGIIPNAEHIAMDVFDPAELDLSDGRTVILYCRSGRRSRIVGEKLAAHTGEPAIHLEGGIISWKAEGQPVE